MIDAIAHEATEDVHESMMTHAEFLEARGEARGALRGQATVVLRQLRLRFRRVPRTVAERVRAGSEAELERWSERLLSAPTLAEVFVEPR